jgi:hypothetical protein
MYRLLLFAALTISTFSFSQDTGRLVHDSAVNGAFSDSLQRVIEKRSESQKDIGFFSELMRQRKELQKKQATRQAILYISIGVLLLLVLFIGLRRRLKR